MNKNYFLILALLLSMWIVSCANNENDAANTNPAAEGRCGDGVCDGPENADNCAKDCNESGMVVQQEGKPEEPQPQDEAVPEDGYRFVSFSGTIHTANNDAAMGDFSGRVLEYSGDYRVKLWFPMNGGEAVKQENTIILTDYRDRLVNAEGCATCEWVLDAASYEPYSFELSATLTLEGIMEGDETVDELAYSLMEVPMKMITGEVTCCGDPGPVNDPAAFPALLGWFMLGVTNPIELNVLETNTVEDFPVSPVYNINIPLETLSYTTVDALTTP